MSSWRTSHFPQHPQQQQGGGGGGFYGNYPNHGQQSSSNAGGGNNNGGAGVPIENGPRAKCDQVVFEAIAKAAEIVVGSRCWIDPTTIAVQQQQLMNYTNQAGTHNNYVGAGNGQYNGGSSSRFNLLVPEVQGVRSILQRWKRALHVPLRLDVYYQHADGQRELLERWCLEYAPKTGERNMIPGTFSTSDPIVQLRQVCKNIVIWLRTLYCWSRLLPAQALRKVTTQSSLQNPNIPPPIGFSIYVVSEGQDDVSGLMTNQGYHSQGQPHGVLTPYGELGWKVFFAPRAVVQRLLPVSQAGIPYQHQYSNGKQQPTSQNDSTTTGTVTMDMTQQYNSRAMAAARGVTSKTQPIPMQQQPQQQQQYAPQTQHQQQYGASAVAQYVPTKGHGGVARSAPQQQGRLYRRCNSDYDGDNGYAHTGRSYHQRRQLLLRMGKAKSGEIDERLLYGPDEDGDDDNTGGGIERPVYRPGESQSPRYQQPLSDAAVNNRIKDDRPPTKNLSALSLALMMSDEQSASLLNHSLDTAGDSPEGSGGEDGETLENRVDGATTTVKEAAAAEKRRAALHNAPPQLFTTNSPAAVAASPLMNRSGPTGATTGGGMGTHHPRVAATAGEYGYGYNVHIPTLEQYHQHGSGPNTPITPNASNTSGLYQQHHSLPPPSAATNRIPLTMEGATSVPPGTYSPSFRPSTPLSSTPPGYLLGATPGTHLLVTSLIPPRNAVTPPFVRPMGFVGEPPSQPMLPPAASAASTPQASTARIAELDTALHQHQTSLDLLHSSPFQYPPSYSYYSIHNNITNQATTSSSHLAHGLDPNTAAAATFLSDYYHRSAHSSSDDPRLSFGQEIYDDFGDDMPFAVDSGGAGFGSSTTAQSTAGTGGTAGPSGHPSAGGLATMAEASLVASICTTAPKRLAMFDSKMSASVAAPGSTDNNGVTTNDLSAVMDSLADQLAEFQSFGASLKASSSTTTYAATATASSSS